MYRFFYNDALFFAQNFLVIFGCIYRDIGFANI